jgi:hypothetical protein
MNNSLQSGDRGGWIYQDPTFNCYWKVDEQPASALTLHEAVMSGKPIAFAPREPKTELDLGAYYMDPREAGGVYVASGEECVG